MLRDHFIITIHVDQGNVAGAKEVKDTANDVVYCQDAGQLRTERVD